MFTGRTDTPCCLCGSPTTDRRIEVPPRAVTLMENSGPIAWQDIVTPVTLQFCADDWELVRDLAVEMDHHPLSRCNVAYASFDHAELEGRLLERSREVLADADDPMTETRDVVEAAVIDAALAELDAVPPTAE